MPQGMMISEQDVARVAEAMSCRFDDEGRREALMCTESRDVQACPGSGKTTLVVAKLMILVDRWRWHDRGVCVLSHTNVAREELEKRLGQHPMGHRLLGYPHFIGTIQRFVDQFLALPCLRSRGLAVTIIDNDRLAARAMRLLPRYRTASAYLGHRQDGRSIVSGLRFEGPDLTLGSACSSGLTVGQSTPTHGQLAQLKWRMCEEGVFRFDDMYAFAQAYMSESPEVIEGLRYRFPWVFVDEMQDTDEVQDDLIQTVFGEQCILQRFGDANQAIYSAESVADCRSTFPAADLIHVSGSMRFGSTIAGFASPLTAAVPQLLVGLRSVPARRHSVFLFGPEEISRVLSHFGNLLASEYGGGLPAGYVAKAVGFRKSEPDASAIRRLPFNIGDYWRQFDPRLTVRSPKPSTLVEYVALARDSTRRRGECREGYATIIESLLELFRLQGARDDAGSALTRTRLFAAFQDSGQSSAEELRSVLAELCLSTAELTRRWWGEVEERVRRLIEPWSSGGLTTSAREFLVWVDQAERLHSEAGLVPTSSMNVYRYDSAVGPIDIEVTTIHAVKGQNHDATLVLETFWRGHHDLAEMVEFLTGERSTANLSAGNSRERMKRVFVGMTRPKDILCLALHRDHATAEQRTELAELGWCIEDLGG